MSAWCTWRDAEKTLAMQMHDAGASNAEIATRLQRTVHAVKYKLHEMLAAEGRAEKCTGAPHIPAGLHPDVEPLEAHSDWLRHGDVRDCSQAFAEAGWRLGMPGGMPA